MRPNERLLINEICLKQVNNEVSPGCRNLTYRCFCRKNERKNDMVLQVLVEENAMQRDYALKAIMFIWLSSKSLLAYLECMLHFTLDFILSPFNMFLFFFPKHFS